MSEAERQTGALSLIVIVVYERKSPPRKECGEQDDERELKKIDS